MNLSSAEVEKFQSRNNCRYSKTGYVTDIAVLSETVSTCPFRTSNSMVPLLI